MNLEDARKFENQGRYLDAEKIFRALVKSDPNNGHAYWGLGRLALTAGYAESAVSYLNKACHLLPNEPKPLIHLANAFNGAFSEQDALTVLDYAVKTFPKVAQLHYELGQQQLTMGRLTEAESCFHCVTILRNTVEPDQLSTSAFYEICQLRKINIGDPYLRVLEKRLSSPALINREEVFIRYALAKVQNDNENFTKAWQHYQRANSLQLAECEFKTAELEPFFQNIKMKNKENSLFLRRTSVNDELTPIFILGLPRTGSSLLEYTLTKHPDISGAGELPYIGQQLANYFYSQTNLHYPDFLPVVNSGQMEEAAHIYLNLLAKHAKERKFVIDKLPANFQSIGLIYKLFPNAKVIHLTRELPATAWSVFSNYFAENEPYFCSLSEFKQYSDLHDELMEHWHTQLPGFVYEASYEKFIENPQECIQSILHFCGLKWHDACLAEAGPDVPVKTLSKVQVRKPIKQNASDSWKNYEQHLGVFYKPN